MTSDFDSLEDLQTPALVIDLDCVRENVEAMRLRLGGDIGRWQPHIKTAKVPEVFKILLEAGVCRFKCATTREAACLLGTAEHSIELVVAMAHHGPKLKRLSQLAADYPEHEVSLLSEDPAHSVAIQEESELLGIWVDIDPGQGRSGIPLNQRERIQATSTAAGSRLRGLHFYEGDVRDDDPARRAAACEPLFRGLCDLANHLDKSRGPAGAEGRLSLLTSGTPTFEAALDWSGFNDRDHRVSPGTVVYWDSTSQAFGIPGFSVAATVLSQVISRPSRFQFTCDAGSKALDSSCENPIASVAGENSWVAQSASEEHLPFVAVDGDAPAIGVTLELIPRHVCPTVNLADDAILVESGNSPKCASVTARGHENLSR